MAGLNSSVFTYSSPGSLVAPQPREDPFIFVPRRTEFEVKPDESPILTPGGAFNPYPPGLEPEGQQPKVAPKIPGIERVNDYIKAVSIAAGGVQDVIRAFKGEPRMEFYQALLDKGLDPETAKDVVEKEGEPESPLEQARKAMGAPPSIPGYEDKDVIGDFYPYPGRIIGTPGMIGGSLPA